MRVRIKTSERNDTKSLDSKVPDCICMCIYTCACARTHAYTRAHTYTCTGSSEGGHHSLGLRNTLDKLVLWEQRLFIC